MLYLYIDESGDLGFDFDNKRSSCYFTITILLIDGADNRARISKAITKTKKTKLNKFKNTEVKPIIDGVNFSVLVPLIEINNEFNLIFEVRSMSIKSQPGEISFPGGRIEDGESPLEAAVRETFEETGIAIENIEIISELDYASNKNGSFVYSFLGHIKTLNIQI